MMGLVAVPGDAAERVLAAQLRSADHVAPLRQAMNVFGLIFLWQVFGHHGSAPRLMLWSAALVLSMGVGAFLRRRRNAGGVSATDLRVQGFTGLLHGLVWAACMMSLSSGHGAVQLVAHWTLISCIMVCGAISYAPTPLAATGFLLPCIVGLFVMFGARDQAPLLALATSYALLLLVGCFLYARTFARQHSASVQLEEKSEVVSLLLREYEHGASDWLWQTDPARRLNGVSPRLAEMLGRTPAEAEGVLLVQLLAGSAWESGLFPTELHALADHLKRRASFSNIVLPVELAGGLRWWELSASPRYDEGGDVPGFPGRRIGYYRAAGIGRPDRAARALRPADGAAQPHASA